MSVILTAERAFNKTYTPKRAMEPGRTWRRVARCGALATVLAAYVFPFGGSSFLNDALIGGWNELLDVAASTEMTQQILAGPGASYWLLIVAFCCLCPALFASGPACLVLCRPTSQGELGRARMWVAGALWLSTTVPPYFFAIVQLNLLENQETVSLCLALLSGYLLIIGLSALSIKGRKSRADRLFWLGLFPIVMAAASWFLLLFISIGMATMVPGWSLIFRYATVGVGCLGVTTLLVAWTFWWRTAKSQPT